MKRFLCAILILGLSPMLAAYVIYLKDGSTYMARSKYTVENGKALITLTNGTIIAVDLGLVDAGRTESANKAGLDTDGILPSVGSSTIITSNRHITEWVNLFDDSILANSALDRLAHNAHQMIIEEARSLRDELRTFWWRSHRSKSWAEAFSVFR